MPRKPRYHLPNIPIHLVQRGHSKSDVFFDDEDKQVYLDWLDKSKTKYQCQLHAYVLMSNHIHLLVTPSEENAASSMMQYLGRLYVPYINRKYKRSGTLWEGRYKSSPIEDERYLLNCMRYIELNPVRANMVSQPDKYQWSSYIANAYGKNIQNIDPHPCFMSLSKDDKTRRKLYRQLCKDAIHEVELQNIRSAWKTGTPLGSEQFLQHVEKVLKTKVGYPKRGRPRTLREA